MKEKNASWNYAQIWDKFPIPARPCSKELAIIEKKLSEFVGTPKVLILGSTIEYRSLCKKLGIRPVVADFVKSNYDLLSEYSDEKFENEEFFETDWLKINQKNTYDFILGHRIFNVIRREDIEKMFNIMSDALKSNGIFFCRGNVYDKSFSNRLDHFVDKHAFSNREFPLFTYLEVALYMKCCDEQNYIDYAQCRSVVDSWFEQGKISKEDFDHMKLLVSMSDDARFRTATREEVISGYVKANFSEVSWVTTGDEFSMHMPIIQLQK